MSAAKTLDRWLDSMAVSALNRIERMAASAGAAWADPLVWRRARYGAALADIPTPPTVIGQRTPKRKQRTATGHGYRKNMRARSDVLKHFLARPADINRSARDLQADIRASKSTINAVQQQIARAAETANMTAEEMLRRMRK